MSETIEQTRTAMWVLAHPLRFRIWELLREGPSTASRLARRLGESRGTASYHLRILGRAGAIEEDESLGTRRERWWRRPESLVVADPGADAEGRALNERMLAVFFARDEEVRHRYLASRPSAAWHDAAFVGNWFVRLTPHEADELGRALFALVDDRRRRPARASAAQAHVSVTVLPVLGPR
ncbi:MAG TPA: winged helix-turn-helix domain-containing protein [Gaiellaceae bacterium]